MNAHKGTDFIWAIRKNLKTPAFRLNSLRVSYRPHQPYEKGLNSDPGLFESLTNIGARHAIYLPGNIPSLGVPSGLLMTLILRDSSPRRCSSSVGIPDGDGIRQKEGWE